MNSASIDGDLKVFRSKVAKESAKKEVESITVASLTRDDVDSTTKTAEDPISLPAPKSNGLDQKKAIVLEQKTAQKPEEIAIVQNVKAESAHQSSSDDASESRSPMADDSVRAALDVAGPSCGQEEQVRSSRMMRNLAEKMRRDKLNMYISELSNLVPIVAMATKRMDKTSVLRLSANFLRIHLSLKQQPNPRPKCTPDGLQDFLSNAVLEAIEGFMLIVSTSGKIVYISDSIEKLLGHSQMDLMGQSLYTICHNGDHELLRHHLQPSRPFEAREDGESTEGVDYVPRSPSFFGGAPDETLNGLASGERRSFYVRLAERSMARGDPARHVTVHLIGYLRPPDNAKKDTSKNSKGKKESTSTVEEPMLVCIARPFRNKGITELSLMEAVQDEYVTRHTPDGRIIYSDHRIAFVAGYLTEEVMGHSAFNFIHHDDRPWATVANRQMFSSVEGQGYSVYRLRSKTGDLIHLRTRGFLEFNKTTQKVETFVCINTLLTSEEGDKELEKERERITPFITFQQVTTTSSTNLSASTGSSAQLTSPSTATSTLPDSLQLAAIPITSKVIHTTFKLTKVRGDASSSIMSNSSSSTVTSANSALGVAPLSSSLEDCTGGVMIEELPADDLGCSSDSVLSSATSDLVGSGDWQVNGNGMKTINRNSLKMLRGSTSTISSPQSTPNMGLMDLADAYINVGDQLVDTTVQQTATSAILSSTIKHSDSQVAEIPGNLLPRLKRSFAEVEDLVVTSSAKRPIAPSAFISSYSHSPLHHPSHLGSKWGTETTTTLLFDQHNNNG